MTRKLLFCYPNPANSAITFQYFLAEPVDVDLRVYNTLGQEVKQVHVGKQSAGLKKVHWNGCDNHGRRLSAGVYFCRIQSGDRKETKKVVLLK